MLVVVPRIYLFKMGEYSAMCEKVLRTLENIIERDSEM